MFKYLLLLWAAIAMPVFAQNQGGGITQPGGAVTVTASPNGNACTNTPSQAQALVFNGTVYTCQSGTYQPITGTSTGTLTGVTAGTGLTGGGTSGNVPVAVDSTVTTLTGTQTLTNKSLTSPALTGTPTLNATPLGPYVVTPTVTGDGTLNAGTGALAVSKINGGAIPATAVLGSNGSNQAINISGRTQLFSGISVDRDIASFKDPIFGGKCDVVPFQGTIGASSTSLIATTPQSTANIVGKTVQITSAAQNYVTTITGFTDSTHFTVAGPGPTVSFTNHFAALGSDDTSAFALIKASGISHFIISSTITNTAQIAGCFVHGTIPLGEQLLVGVGAGTTPAASLAQQGSLVIYQLDALTTGQGTIWMDYPNITGASFKAGIENISIQSNSTASGSGVVFGGVNGAIGAHLFRAEISGFDRNIDIENNTYGMHLMDVSSHGAHKCFYMSPAPGAGGESFNIDHSFFNHCGPDFGATDITAGVDIETNTYALNFNGGSIVNAQIKLGGNGVVNLNDPHLENPTNNTQPYIDQTTGVINAKIDVNLGIPGAGGPTSMATVSGGTLNILDGSTIATGLTANPPMVTISSAGCARIGYLPNSINSGFTQFVAGSSTCAFDVSPQVQTMPQATTSVTTLNQGQNFGFCNGSGAGFNLPAVPVPNRRVAIINVSTNQPCTVNGNGNNIGYGGASVTSLTIYPQSTQEFVWSGNQISLWLSIPNQNVSNQQRIVGAGGTLTLTPAGVSGSAATSYVSAGTVSYGSSGANNSTFLFNNLSKALLLTNGFDLTLGNKYQCTHGTNGTCGVVTLAAGTATISTTAIAALAASGAAGDFVQLSCANNPATTTTATCATQPFVSAVTTGTSFTIGGTSTDTVYWEIKHIN